MAKKKAQNSARGFATTSTIKKKEPEPELELERESSQGPIPTGGEDSGTAAAPHAASSQSVPSTATNASPSSRRAANDGTPVSSAASDWDASEEKRAHDAEHALAERVRAASEKELSKAWKVIEYERRVSSNLTEFSWNDPTNVRDRIVELALAEGSTTPPVRYSESDEKLLSRIAGLFLILRKCGFTQDQVEECLRTVPRLELDDALDWLYLRYTPVFQTSDPFEVRVKPYGQGSWHESSPGPPAATPKERPALAKPVPTPVPPAPAASPAPTKKPPNESGGSGLLAYRSHNSDSDSASDSDRSEAPDEAVLPESASVGLCGYDTDEMEDNPDAAYISTKVQITSLQRKLGIATKGGGKKGGAKTKARPTASAKVASQDDSADIARLEALEALLKRVQQMYLFDQKRAEAAYLTERARVDKIELAERLAGKAKTREQNGDTQGSSGSASTAETQTASPGTDSRDATDIISKTSEDEDLFGDMLEAPAEPSQTESSEPERNSAGTIIAVRDVGLPKNYAGKTPRLLLDDALRRLDKFAKVTYRVISRSRAIRAVATIRWDSGRLEQYGMEDEACETQEQAFNYAATLALFAVSQDGSAHRLLPAKFRDLWDELEGRQRDAEKAAYALQMKIYTALAEARRENAGPSATIKLAPGASATRQVELGAEQEAGPAMLNEPESAPQENLKEQLAQRQSLPSYQAMLAARQSLPIAAYRDAIVSTIEGNQVVVLCGETGCGKSTQTPTMILESQLGKGQHVKIYCTEPRRISAISLAQRVSQELGEAPGALGGRNSYIGYNIRLESKVSAATRLTYATTGILLRMLEGDTELRDVTHIIIDEVHERSIDSDFLLIILRSLLKRRKDLRVLLMSATVDAEKIAEYMGGCPVINVPGRTFPVSPYFLEDAVEMSNYRLEADSDSPYVQRVQRKGKRQTAFEDLADLDDLDDTSEYLKFGAGYSKQTLNTLQIMDENVINLDLMVQLLETICFGNPKLQDFSHAILIFLPSLETIRKVCDLLESHPQFGSREFRVFPLHSSISNEQQARVFEVPPRGIRKIVVSTNIAETGVTIPDVTAVIDSGRHKEMRFDEKRQISRLVECWIARSNGMQRRGRAGRVQEGICFHMFSKARFESALPDHPIPEMLRLSLQDLALRIKILKFPGSIEDTLSQGLDPPTAINIQRAIQSLIEVKALNAAEEITQLGRHLVKLPLDVHTAKLCLLATIFGCLDAALTIAATLNSKSFFLTPFGREAEADTIKRSFKVADEHSDFMVMYRAYKLWRQNCLNGTWSTFCRKHFLSHQNLVQIEELKCQYIGNLCDAGFIGKSADSDNGTTRYPKCPRVRFAQLEPHLDRFSDDASMVMAVIAAAMHPKLVYKDVGAVWKTLSNNAPVAIHPSSSNFLHGRKPDFGNASFLTFFNIQQSKRLYVWENGAVSEKAVMLLCGEADVKHVASSLSVDRKIRRHVDRKSGLAIELLRTRFDELLQARLDAPTQPLSERHESWFRLLEEALASESEQERLRAAAGGRADKPAVAINVVKLAR